MMMCIFIRFSASSFEVHFLWIIMNCNNLKLICEVFNEMAYGLFHTTIQNITKKLGVSTCDA
jgi:hypothetical protein